MPSLSDTIYKDLAAYSHRRGLAGVVVSALFSPGFATVLMYRLACAARRKGPIGRIIGKVLWRLNILSSGCFLSLQSNIGPGLNLPHGVGIVVGDDVVIGENVTLYQSVTLGRKSADHPAYPIVGDRVVIYAGAVVVGPLQIGADAVIGANSVVMSDVPSGAVAAGVPARVLG